MVKLVAIAALLMLVLADRTLAETALAKALPEAVQKALETDAARFQDRALDIVAGFGGPEGLTSAGIEEHVALARAAARAGAMRKHLAMDLDGDGAVSRGELAVTQRAASATARGRLERQFVGADSNQDGRVDPAEMRLDAVQAANRALGETEAGALRALMLFDLDGNGAVTAPELRAGITLASAEVEEAT
jgi:EF hand